MIKKHFNPELCHPDFMKKSRGHVCVGGREGGIQDNICAPMQTCLLKIR